MDQKYNENKISFGSITDLEGARAVAKRIFESYDLNSRGELTSGDIAPMMIDAYKSMNKGFNPSKADVDTYFKILDRNNDGRVTLQDIEQIAIKYLVGDNQSKNKRSVVVEQKLEIARKLFNKYDKDKNGSLTREEIAPLLLETFQQMGINYTPTQKDIDIWIKQQDTNKDGYVNLSEYEELFLRSLQRIGIKID